MLKYPPSMRILILHNSYQQAGGEDAVAAGETALLRNHGHDVHLHTVSNDSIQSSWSKLVTSWRLPHSLWGKREASRILKQFRPHVLHVHNFFPLLTPSIYDACREAGIPVVQTLHNYRTICAGALLMRAGKPCEDCINGSPFQAVLYGCYRGSRLGSLAVARMVDVHRRRGTWENRVDRFIALTEFAKNKFVDAGFPSEKISVKANFIEKRICISKEDRKRSGALFVGRLSEEKGIHTLLQAWEILDISLRIIGDGPLMNQTRQSASQQIEVLGRLESQQVAEEMSRAAFLVMPSECYESFPLSVAEAFAQGMPVIASRLGAMVEIVEEGATGLLFEPGNPEDLARKIRWAGDHPKEIRRMGLTAQSVYKEKYTAEINYPQLMAVYQQATEENNRRMAELKSH